MGRGAMKAFLVKRLHRKVVRTIKELDVTTPSGTVNPPEEENKPAVSGTSEATNQEEPQGDATRIAELEKTVAEQAKAIKGFQAPLQRAIVERDDARNQLAEVYRQAQLAEETGETINPVQSAELARARQSAFNAEARAKATELVMGSKLPDALRKSIIANPLAFITVSPDATERTIAFEVEEKLPTYLESLEQELEPKVPAAPIAEEKAEETTGTPAPGGMSSSSSSTIHADEIDPSTPAGLARFKELQSKIDSKQIIVLPSRKS